jgi:flagellar motor switch protein FliN/FliY
MTRATAANLSQILQLEVPIVVRLGERTLDVEEVLALVPGSIIELPKSAESELDLLVNNKVIGCGHAVKVGENFGLRLTFLGNLAARLAAMSSSPTGGTAAA